MLEPVKDLLRRQSLKKNASTEPTGFVPLEKIRSAVAFIDVEDTSFNECKNILMLFFREHNIKADIFFFDFRKLTEGERLITSITTTILKKDLNWFGKPSHEKVALMLSGSPPARSGMRFRRGDPRHIRGEGRTALHRPRRRGRSGTDDAGNGSRFL